MTDEKLALAKRLKEDFPFFARTCLKIRTKDPKAPLAPFILNEAQLYIHKRIGEQRAKTGKVRALLLKGRQQGGSTYAEGRGYWKTATALGVMALVIAHEQKSSDNLFSMVQRFHEHMPAELRPSTKTASAKELKFGALDSGYLVMTAGTKAVGRGNTATYAHLSEFAFWDKAEDHMTGLAQTVADMEGTEVIIESTANGLGNAFHKMWQLAVAGKSDYIAIFVPWFWQAEYRRPTPAGWKRTSEEDELAALHGLDDEQLAFRRNKIESDFGGDETRFMQEYPCTPDEAFQADKRDVLLNLRAVLRARKYQLPEPATGPLVCSLDPARFGDDRSAFAWRMGREAFRFRKKEKWSTMQLVGEVVRIIREDRPVKFFIDVVGLGAGIVDRLNELGYAHIVVPVNFGESASDPDRYVNKRAECWVRMKEWFETLVVSVPDSDELQQDLLQPGYSFDSAGRYLLESKKDIKKRGAPSPDLADALSLTFAEFVSAEMPAPGGGVHTVADPVGGY